MRRRHPVRPLPWWLHDDLIFWAPLSDPVNPLAIYRGSGAFTFARATAGLRWDGSKFVAVGNNVLRIEPKGALIEGARTFAEMLYTDNSQDLLAQWTKVGITAAFEADATAYGGNRWTLAADASDRIFVRSITIAAAARSLAWYVRRPDGGVVDATFCQVYREGAARASTYTALGGGVYRVAEENFNGSGGAANTGLQIKAGKTLQIVAPAGLENGVFCSSPMALADAGANRNKDALLLPANAIDNTVGTLALEFDFNGTLQYERLLGNAADGGAGQIYVQPFGPTVIPNDGTPRTLNVVASGNVTQRIAIAWGGAAIKGATNGGAVVSDAFGGNMGLDATPILGANTAGGREIFGHIRYLRRWNRVFTDTEIRNLTR